jgi:hypothetical protein
MTNDEKLYELRILLRQVFTTEAAIDEWLDSEEARFSGLSPRQLANQVGGGEKVRALVMQMIHGIPP